MNKNFLAGLMMGLAGSLLVCTLLLSLYTWKENASNTDNNQEMQNTENNKGKKEVNGVNLQEISSKLNLLEQYIDAYYLEDIHEDKFADGIYKGLLYSLEDPYSTYYTAEEYNSLMDSTNGTYCGIGATVSQNINTGIITIVQPFVDCPAYKVGMLPGDILYTVNEEEVTGTDLTAVVSKMKGKEGTTVDMEIIREGEEKPLKFTLTRENIEVQTVVYEMMEDKIGYISVSEFDTITGQQFCNAVDDLETQGMKGLVIDLRNNGGGVLDAAVTMLDRMLPEGIIVSTKDKNGEGEEFKSTQEEFFDKPLTLLINGNSASASEVFAGAIQDYKLGTLVGTISFGKGIVQSVIPLKDGSAIKLTTSKYYTPDGRNIHGTGIEPEVKVELKEGLKKQVVIDKKEDNQLQKAIEVLKEKIK